MIKSFPDFLFHNPKFPMKCQYQGVILASESFTAIERMAIQVAVAQLIYFCNGLIELEVDFILKENDKTIIEEWSSIQRVQAYHPSVKAIDNRANPILGLCEYHESTTRLYLITNRLIVLEKFRVVTLHELLHFIGLDHTEYWGLMCKQLNELIPFPTYEDAAEAARVWQVSPDQFRYFKL